MTAINELVDIAIAECETKLVGEENKNSRRLFHGRGGCFPGLNWCCIDIHASVLLMTLYDQPPETWLQKMISEINENCSRWGVETLLVQRRFVPGAPIETVIGVLPEAAFAYRNGLKFKLSFEQQNIGFFLDIEAARSWLESNSKACRVLNLFSYTCTFSVVAMQAGANSVVNIDMSRRALNTGIENHRINDLPTENVKFLPHDILKSWGKLKKQGPYDVVVIDPPSFQKGSFIAKKDYKRVLSRMQDLVADKGCFLACLNSPEIEMNEFEQEVEQVVSKGFKLEERLPLSEDFPDENPERGLKLLVYRKA